MAYIGDKVKASFGYEEPNQSKSGTQKENSNETFALLECLHVQRTKIDPTLFFWRRFILPFVKEKTYKNHQC